MMRKNEIRLITGLLFSLIVLFAACDQKTTKIKTVSEGVTDTILSDTIVAYSDEVEMRLTTYEDNEKFVRCLIEHPDMMNLSADSIYKRFGVSIDESDDKCLRLYSWFFDNAMGGRYNNYTLQVCQYRGANNVHTIEGYLSSLFPDDDYPFLDGNTYVGEIMTFNYGNQNRLYVVPYHVVAAGGLTVYSFCTVTINGDILKPVAVFPSDEENGTKYVLVREIDFLLAPNRMHERGDWDEVYMKRGNELWIKTENVEDAFYSIYRFDGMRFINIGEKKLENKS